MTSSPSQDEAFDGVSRMGESAVSAAQLAGRWRQKGPDWDIWAQVWLGGKESARRDAREAETRTIARRANAIAIIAAVIAAVSAITVILVAVCK